MIARSRILFFSSPSSRTLSATVRRVQQEKRSASRSFSRLSIERRVCSPEPVSQPHSPAPVMIVFSLLLLLCSVAGAPALDAPCPDGLVAAAIALVSLGRFAAELEAKESFKRVLAATVKLLSSPSLSPSPTFRSFFATRRQGHSFQLPAPDLHAA